MIKKLRKSRAIAVFLAFALLQVCIQLSFAAPVSAAPAVPQQFIARLTTTGNQPITVNNASAASGASLLTGATIETPAAVSATIDLGPLGTIELQPNSAIQLDFDDNGNVRVKLLRGCVVMRKSGQGSGEVYTAEGSSEKTSGGALPFCYLNGSLSPIGQTAAAAGAGGGGGGIGTAALVAILAGGGALAAGLIWAFSGDGGNPSPA